MKIIQKREAHKRFVTWCGKCSSELEYTSDDVKCDMARGYPRFFIVCPVCGKKEQVYLY